MVGPRDAGVSSSGVGRMSGGIESTPDLGNLDGRGAVTMIVTSMAMMDLEARRRSLRDRIRVMFGHHHGDGDIVTFTGCETENVELDGQGVPDLPVPSEHNFWRWRRHPQLRAVTRQSPIGETERRARHSAVHGLYAALAGNVDDASAWFLQAVSVHDIDLTEIPSFWQMPRAAIESAAVAYECVGRFREAAMVQARLRSEFRPRNVVALRLESTEPEHALEAAVR